MSPPEIPESVRAAVSTHAGRIRSVRPLGGGCIANASRVETDAGPLFLKWGAGAAGAGFAGEAAGLRALAAIAPAAIAVPLPLAFEVADAATPGFLVTEWIEPARAPAHWEHFGASLADLHRATASGDGRYGFETETFCGPTPQPNEWTDDWPTFFRERRLAPMAERLRATVRWESAWDPKLDHLLAEMDDRLPERPAPALLHGDLWSGNAFATARGATALVDPACYIGDREADLAMTELFGGFDRSFYDAYSDAWPLEPGYAGRREVYNLYHLMNHLLLFGGSYAGAVARTLSAIMG